MKKETQEIMDSLTIPNPPTMKTNPRFRYTDEKVEAKRLFKSLKAGLLCKEHLTEHGIELVKRFYPFMR